MLEIVSKLSYTLNDDEIENLNYFLKIKPNDIKKAFDFDDNYYQYIKRYLQSIIKSKFVIKDIYKQRSYKNSSRLYGVGQTLQSMSADILSMIFGDTSYDIDMVNASFHFLKFINHKYFKEENDMINDYCINRKDYLDDKHTKQFFITALFHSNTKQLISSSNNKKQNELLTAIDQIKIKIGENLHLFNLKFDEGMHSGQKLVKIIHHYESTLLNNIIPDFENSTKALKHDGFVVDNDIDLEQALEICNKKGKEYGVKFISKPFNDVPTFTIEEEPAPQYSEKCASYISMKEQFEKNNFMVLNPLMYYQEKNGIPIEYNKKDFKDLIKPYQLPTEKGTKDFFDDWLKDENRRTYEKMLWRPSLDKVDGEYNYFKGFRAKLIPKEIYDKEKETKYVEAFGKHVNNLCGGNQDAYIYVLSYIAHLIQYPQIRPDTFIIMVSEKGTGKDKLIDFIEAIIGKDLIYRDCNMNNIVGNFNEGLEHKLVLQMNELDGKDGHGYANAIKDLITRNTHNINKKYGKKKDEINYLRGFCFFNGLNSMKVEAGSRRFLVCKSNDPKSKSYYDKLHKLSTNDEAINYIYTWLNNYDISKWSSRKIPQTEYYNALVQANTNHYYKFLHNIINNPTEYGVRQNKKTKLHYIKLSSLTAFYKEYVRTNEITNPMKKDTISLILTRENFESCKMNFKTQAQQRGYRFNLEQMKTKFDKKYGNDDDLVEDDFSDEEYEFDNKE